MTNRTPSLPVCLWRSLVYPGILCSALWFTCGPEYAATFAFSAALTFNVATWLAEDNAS